MSLAAAPPRPRPTPIPEQATFSVRNPATGAPIAEVPDVGLEGAERALRAAQAAFAGWATRPAEARAEILQAAARLMHARLDALARTLTLENGKPLAESRGEVGSAARFLQWSGEEAKRVYGRTIPATAPDRRYLALKQPVGVVAAITPWNYPSSMVARKAGPALAAGCTVVLRPASATPLSAVALGELLSEVGLPEGVFTVVTTKASAPIGELFATHPLVRKLTFTGSTEVGKHLLRLAAGTVKRVSLELGGHAPVLVFPDADLEKAADGVISSKFRNTGQNCIAANRLYVERSIAERFSHLLAERAAGLRVGDGLREDSQLGPLINQRALDRVSDQVQDATARGARILVGGNRLRLDGLEGLFFEPTVLADVPPDAKVAREETFGPLIPVIAFDTEEEAIRAANDTPYGLAAYAYTRDVGRVFRLMEALDVGIVGINDPGPGAPQLPFGGVKESGLGRENAAEGIEAFLETKAVSIGI